MEKDQTELVKSVSEKRGFSLNYHKLLAKNDPELLRKWDDLYTAGAFQKRFLSNRELELVGITINTVLKWSTGLQIHLKRAIDLGVTEQEIMQVFSRVAMTVGIPCMIFGADVYAELKKNNFKYFFTQPNPDEPEPKK